MFILQSSRALSEERQYVLEVVFREFLGLDVVLEPDDDIGPVWRLRLRDSAGPMLEMPDLFLSAASRNWMQPGSVPDGQGPEFRVEGVPLPRGFSSEAVPGGLSREAWLGYDVLGLAFFMLTRYEERVLARRDRYGRFAAAFSSLGSSYDPVEPLVDHAVGAMAEAIVRLWPSVRLQEGAYGVMVTHDVDALRNRGRELKAIVAAVGSDVLRRRSPALAWRRGRAWLRSPSVRLDPADPFNTFEFLMQESERNGHASHFYFVPEAVDTRFDPDYSVRDQDVRNLMGLIHSRGHQIGLHASFGAAHESGRITREFEVLMQAADAAGVKQQQWGGRHHYLRWRPESSWSDWSAAGLNYDSSVGFAEAAGFRCGTSRDFPVWDLTTRRRLALRERPLVVMDSTLFGYQQLDEERALSLVLKLSRRCRRYGGRLVLLWHNHNLLTDRARRFYSATLAAVSKQQEA